MVSVKNNANRIQRRCRIRSKIFGTAKRPRLSVYRSNKFIYAQLVNDEQGKTLISASTLKSNNQSISTASQVGQTIAQKALKLGIKIVVFDRGGYKYHGQIKAVADGAREAGLKF